MTPRIACWLTWTLTVGLACVAGAQTVPSARQIELNNQGLDAQDDGNHGLAAQRFREALAEGELNLIYLNLGRALQKSGDCMGADDAYRAALTAPQIEEPAPALIERTIQDFRTEMNRECPGAVVVLCDADRVEVEVGGREWTCNKPLSVIPGTVKVTAGTNGKLQSRDLRVVALEGSSWTVEGDVPTPPSAAENRDVDAPNARASAAIGLFGAGGALMFTGVVFTVLTVQANDDIVSLAADGDEDGIDSIQATEAVARSRNYEVAQFLSYTTGLVCLATAFTLYYWEGISESLGWMGSVTPEVTPGGARLHVGFTW